MHRRIFLTATGAVLAPIAGCLETSGPREADTTDTDGDSSSAADTTANGDNDSDDEDENEADDEPESDDEAIVGERITGDDFEFVVVETREESDDEGLTAVDDETSGIGVISDDPAEIGISDDDTAADDVEFLVVEVAVKNTSQDSFRSVDDLLDPAVRGAEDRTLSRRSSVADAILETNQLAPGEVERFEFVYDVSDDASVTTLSLVDDDADRAALDRSTVNLEEEADSIEELEHDFRVPLQEFGESVEQDDVTVAVDQLELGNDIGISAFDQPEDDHEQIMVGFTVTNDSGTELDLSTLEQFHLKDTVGRNYRTDPELVTSLEQFDDADPLEDDESRTGTLAYEVEQDLEELFWIVDFSQWGDGDRTIWQLR